VLARSGPDVRSPSAVTLLSYAGLFLLDNKHSTTLSNSIYRSDATMLVNMHMYGSGAPANPVMHLQRVAGGRLFESYRRSVESVWEVAVPTTEF